MIAVLALAGAVTTVASSISSAIQAGKDINSVMPSFGKLAQLESEISLAEAGKHKGPLGRLSSSDQEGFAIAQAKMALRQAQNELRSLCLLYGPPHMWETVLKEQAAARVRHKNALELRMRRRDTFFWVLSLLFGVCVFMSMSSLMFYGASFLAN
jgi:hypothetical protein